MRAHLSNKICSRRAFFCATVAVAFLSTMVLSSCKKSSGQLSEYPSAEQAITDYRKTYSELQKAAVFSTDNLCEQVKRWKQQDKLVDKAVRSEEDEELIVTFSMNYMHLRDSIKSEFKRLVQSQERTYKDLLLLKDAINPIEQDSVLLATAKQAEPFFRSLAENDLIDGDKTMVLRMYRAFLKKQLSHDISDRRDMLLFIREEDRFFRSLLQHLHDCGEEDMSDIMKDTEACCAMIYQANINGKLSDADALVFITVRTNLRLLQNMRKCMEDIHKGIIKSEKQTQAYIYMLLSPYSIIDTIGMSLLSPRDKEELLKLTDEIWKILPRLTKQAGIDMEAIKDIPELLMEITIQQL